MKAIYSSKLYKASKRKAQIQAALNNPLNSELVIQLREYLPEDELKPENDVKDESKGSNEKIRPSSTSGGSKPATVKIDSEDSKLSKLTDELESERESDTEPSEESSVSESTQVSGQDIVSASSSVDKVARDSDSIMGLLNSRADSTGVVSVGIIDNVLHVYFDESVNLNEVMEPAISLLNAAGYSALSFKKLSRSDNAMTFNIDEIDHPMEPMVSDE